MKGERMKRKAAISAEALMCENANPGNSHSATSQQSKKRRNNRSGFLGEDSCIENAGAKRRRLKGAVKKTVTKEVGPVINVEDESSREGVEQREILDDCGVNILSDNSNSCSDILVQQHGVSAGKILQVKNTNIVPLNNSPHLAPLKRPEPPPHSTLVNNLEIDNGSSSFLAAPGDSDLSLVSDDFFKYTNTMSCRPASTQNMADLFNDMPEEIVLHVFKWLPKTTLAKCALVSKRWLKITQDESLWRRLDLGLRTVPPGVVGQVLSRGCAVLRLAKASVQSPVFTSHVTGDPTFPSSSLDSSRLQYLDLSMSSISPECLEQLLTHCSMIRNLSLEMCSLTEAAALAIAGNVNLNILHLGQVDGLSFKGISKILNNCKQLTELNLGWTGLSIAALDNVSKLLRPGLRRLCLTGNRETLTDKHLENIVNNCPNLRELDVSDSSKLSTSSLTMLLEKCHHLESLSTSRCYNITPSSYLMLVDCPQLLYLNVFGVLREPALVELKDRLKGIEINKFMFTSVGRPTVGIKRTSIWNLRVRD